ncbi:MAG: winged helix-turn-helix domain-containing protein [Candidatus Micrarchaeota archaeon]
MEEEKIVLDRQSFEALAVDTRVKILKSLKARRKTLSEIAKEQGMSVSGIKEHLETLEKVGLIIKKDDGHKWKYYELTKKGSDIVAPKELRVWILLSISTFALVASMFAMFYAPTQGPELMAAQAPVPPMLNAGAAASSAMADSEGAPEAFVAESVPMEEPVPQQDAREMVGEDAIAMKASADDDASLMQAEPQADLSLPIAVALVSGVTLIACAAVLVRNRLNRASLK